MVRLFDASAQRLNNICRNSSKKVSALLNMAPIIMTSLSPHAKLVVTFYGVPCHAVPLATQNSRRNVVLSRQVFERRELTLCFAHPAFKNVDGCLRGNVNVVFGEINASRRALEFSRIVKRLGELAKIGLLGFTPGVQ